MIRGRSRKGDDGEADKRLARRRFPWRVGLSVAMMLALLLAILLTRQSCAQGVANLFNQAFPVAAPDLGVLPPGWRPIEEGTRAPSSGRIFEIEPRAPASAPARR